MSDVIKLPPPPREKTSDVQWGQWFETLWRKIAEIRDDLTSAQTELDATQALDSYMIVHTGNGHGSTNTCIRRLSTVESSAGSDITRASTAAAGDSYTINTAGLYFVSFTDYYTAGTAGIAISKNSAQLTTAQGSITASTRICSVTQSASYFAQASTVVRLAVNDVLRPHTGGVNDSTSDRVRFEIRRIL